jgi:hypothetical protein
MGAITAKAAKLLEVGYLILVEAWSLRRKFYRQGALRMATAPEAVVLPGCRSLPIRNDFMAMPHR